MCINCQITIYNALFFVVKKQILIDSYQHFGGNCPLPSSPLQDVGNRQWDCMMSPLGFSETAQQEDHNQNFHFLECFKSQIDNQFQIMVFEIQTELSKCFLSFSDCIMFYFMKNIWSWRKK